MRPKAGVSRPRLRGGDLASVAAGSGGPGGSHGVSSKRDTPMPVIHG